MSLVAHVININEIELANINIYSLEKYIQWCEYYKKFFTLNAGQEHYRLLAWISTQIQSDMIVDIGTFNGFSALAFAYNDKKKVISYDIFDHIPENVFSIKNKSNIEINYMDCTYDVETLLSTDLIFIDIDHQSTQERTILQLLEKYHYKGLVLLNSIKLNETMVNLWNSIKQEKHDITKYGHWCGTGLINFAPEKYNIVLS